MDARTELSERLLAAASEAGHAGDTNKARLLIEAALALQSSVGGEDLSMSMFATRADYEAAVAASPATPSGFVLVPRWLMEQVYGMAREGCEAPGAAYRWCERIDSIIHGSDDQSEYADYARELPATLRTRDCTEPNRAACPRLCMDFCNAAEERTAAPSATNDVAGGG